MSSIFKYIDISEFLTDALEAKKAANPNFSIRSWAINLGIKSHGSLHAMIKGQRNIPKKHIPHFIKSLGLKGQEAPFFELLVDLKRAKTNEEREHYLTKLQTLVPNRFRDITDIEKYSYIMDPLHLILVEMSLLKKFKSNLAWLKTHLRYNGNMRDIEIVIDRLVKLGILEKTKNGFSKTTKHIYTTKEVMSEAVQMYHKKMCQFAAEQVSLQNVEQKEYNAITFNIKLKDLPEIKEQIRQFSDELIQQFEASSGEGEETYQLNVQFFSVSK